MYAIHGITISSRVVEYPDTLSTAEIDRERNAEVRRVMIERFGPGRYLRETRARILDHHEGIGTLYRREMPNEEPLVMIEVVNERTAAAVLMALRGTYESVWSPRLDQVLWTKLMPQGEPGPVQVLLCLDSWDETSTSQKEDLRTANIQNVSSTKLHLILTWPASVPIFIMKLFVAKFL